MTETRSREHDGKRKYDSRKSAKKFIHRSRVKGQHAYLCKVCAYWHLGHMPHDVRFGTNAQDVHAPFPVGNKHSNMTTSALAMGRVKELLTDKDRCAEVASRVVSHIAFIQRTEDRNPTGTEASKFPASYWENVGSPSENWRGTADEWRRNISVATLLVLAKSHWIAIDPRAAEVRIGYGYAKLLKAA